MTANLQMALKLAQAGFHVFPLVPGTKVPIKDLHFKDEASRDPKAIKSWFGRFPTRNIGIYTGRFQKDKALYVIDVDVKTHDGKASFETLNDLYGPLTNTTKVSTPSGGEHHIFTVDEAQRQGTNLLGPGLDVRSRGG